MVDIPRWQRRFSATQTGFPVWSDSAADHLAFVSNESGSWQAWVTDVDGTDRRRVSNEPVGVEAVLVTPDGRVVWWRDDTGDERGGWVAVPFEGGEPEPLLADIPRGWSAGISFAGGVVALGIVTEDEHVAIVAEPGSAPRTVRTGRTPLGVGRLDPPGTGGLSADGGLVCLRHTETGDILHHALMVLNVADGTVVASLVDAGANLDPAAWSPRPGDERLLFTSELGPFERPAIWEPRAGTRRDLPVDFPGAAIPVGWWPDGSAILVRQEFEGAFALHRLDPDTGETTLVADPQGEITDAAVRPDGQIWFQTSDSVHPSRVVNGVGAVVLSLGGEPAPSGRPYRSFWFDNPIGQRVQAFVVTPPGDGPHPTVMSVHGGPEWFERDAFDAETQAFVDAGYAVALVNYRGSTGYGIAFREALAGNPWLPETEDVIAGLDALIAAGITDPERVAFSGWSWGGCLACLNEGLHPERWKAVFAGIPSGDLVAAHWASMPEIRAYDIALYGGTPDDVPERYRERNPMTFVDRAVAPVLIIAGEEDPRCPIEGITPWVDALRSRNVPVDVHLYPQGHHANAVAQQIQHMQLILDFFGRHV
jgi:dipeptidyl aminopeptidase/acylaminoacyl peptidase